MRARRADRHGAWERLARVVAGRPKVALAVAVCLLGTLAVPALGLQTANPGVTDLPADEPVVVAYREIERAFPGAPDDAELVVTGTGLAQAQDRLEALGRRAREVTGGRGAIGVTVAPDGRTAILSVPMPERDAAASRATVERLRADVAPTAERVAPGARAMVTGDAASSADFTGQLSSRTPVVIGFVLALAFVLLVAAFRSPTLAAAVIGLNLLSVAAAYGMLVAVFQHSWAEDLLGFTSSGTITDWLPLFAFVILFGLSMDYTVLVLERVREARRAGRSAGAAAAEGVAATAGTVTSAAIVMVAVFAIFGTLSLLQFKQFGLGLAAAILLDATIVRGIALPAVVSLLGERRWRVAGPSPAPARGAVVSA
jgi:RND superfamily putative drug exporter